MTELVTIASFTNINIAQIAMLQLDMAGIEAVMLDSESVSMDWFLGRALGLIKVQVRAEDVQRATEARLTSPDGARPLRDYASCAGDG